MQGHIYRWDLDKTYLRTEFDSFRDLLRTALQRPMEKRNVPGSAELIRALRSESGGAAQVHFLSGSPRQMRRVLSEKLRLDGVCFEGFILKDNLSNLMRGRLRALKGQLGYKLSALLEARAREPLPLQETLFGDDAERDAFVYSIYADLLARRISQESLAEVMERAGLYSDERQRIKEALKRLPQCDPVQRIIIHLDRRSPPQLFAPYGSRVFPVYNYFQAALLLLSDGRLGPRGIQRLGEVLIREHGFSLKNLRGSLRNVIQRGGLSVKGWEQLSELEGELGALFQAEHRLGHVAVTPRAVIPDYPLLLERELHRKKRRWRWS